MTGGAGVVNPGSVPAALQLHIREKVYDNGVCTLRDVQFAAGAGEFVAIVGPSGTGKTTLLNIIAGLDTDVAGDIRWHGQPLAACGGSRLGFMFQEARLMPWLTVEQNIRLVLHGQPEGEDAASLLRMQALLERVGLQDFRAAYPRQLSGGMQRRVSLVRAFVVQPQLLLMDEPFQSLDEPTANQLRDLLLELWAETGATVLFVTHSLREALTLADRVLFLSARPAQVVLDYTVPVARPRQADGAAVATVQTGLMARYPGLLSGLVEPTPNLDPTLGEHS